LSQPKVNRSKSRETALHILFCQQFSENDFLGSVAAVEATQTLETLQETMAAIRQLTDASVAAMRSLVQARESLAEAVKPPDQRGKWKKGTEGTVNTRLHLDDARSEAIAAAKGLVQTLEGASGLFDDKGYAVRLLRTFDRSREKVISVLERSLEGWSVRRLTAEDGSVLKLGITELLFFDDVPPRVAINEYIELSKRYGDNDSPKLVNGVLDRVLRDNPRGEEKD